MAVAKPADHVKKGLEPRGSVERLTHPYVVATIRLCLGGGRGVLVTRSRVNRRKSDTGGTVSTVGSWEGRQRLRW